MATGETVFELPTLPQEFGVVLPPAQLRRINFSALDFTTIRRSLVEYIQSYFPDRFNDFVQASGTIMFMELVAAVGNILSLREDVLVGESFFSTCQTRVAGAAHMGLINQAFKSATPAVADVEVSVGTQLGAAVSIPAGLRFNLTGSDGKPLFYELYRAPKDFTSKITIPAGKRGVIAFGLEGRFADPVVVQSAGGPDQSIDILGTDILSEPIFVDVTTGSTTTAYTRVSSVRRYGANDTVFEVRFLGDRAQIVFGDNVAGRAPLSGQTITVRYRVGGGIRGRIDTRAINEARQINPDPPASAPVEVFFRNIGPSSGGQDEESLEAAKARAPKEAATQGSATAGEDYAILSKTFNHPVFGSVLRAVAVLRTGVEADLTELAEQVRAAATVEEAVEILGTNFVNENIVELYVLAAGPDNIPVTPSAGLKQGLAQYFSTIAVLTDEVRVLDGAIKAVDITANVIISRTADAGTVKTVVDKTIDDFFNVVNFDMGKPLYLSNLYEAIQNVPGVKFVTIFSPVDDIIPTGELAIPGTAGVGFNELITLGTKKIQFFFERGAANPN